MGSYDKEPAGWSEFSDAAWSPQHVIRCNSGWMGMEPHSHERASEVRNCFRAARANAAARSIVAWPCAWLLEGRYDDGSRYSYPCAEVTMFTDGDGSYQCAAGHSHVPAWIRARQGWDYASDEQEAALLRKNGTNAVAMDGSAI